MSSNPELDQAELDSPATSGEVLSFEISMQKQFGLLLVVLEKMSHDLKEIKMSIHSKGGPNE